VTCHFFKYLISELLYISLQQIPEYRDDNNISLTMITRIFVANLLFIAGVLAAIPPRDVYAIAYDHELMSKISDKGGVDDDKLRAIFSENGQDMSVEGEKHMSKNDSNSNIGNKLVIINFDDSHDDQILYAKPILDRYGFKATFFHICGRISDRGWEELAQLRTDGMDIQAHTMTHPNLNKLSPAMLDTEIHRSKDCFLYNGFNTTIFAFPYGNGWNNKTVVNMVARNYDLARTDSTDPLTFLNCDLWNGIPYGIGANYSSNSMPSCIRNENDTSRYKMGNLTDDLLPVLGSSRYAINSWSHKHIEGPYDYGNLSCIDICQYYNNSQMFKKFVEAVNSQNKYNEDGIIRAIPIIVYHKFVPYDDVSKSKIPTNTSVNLFELEMKYLHDNGFKVMTMADLGYDQDRRTLYIRDIS
jgi:peptidoglycan/xylan/chitin deacetylase (PgdA/CDA1 family)